MAYPQYPTSGGYPIAPPPYQQVTTGHPAAVPATMTNTMHPSAPGGIAAGQVPYQPAFQPMTQPAPYQVSLAVYPPAQQPALPAQTPPAYGAVAPAAIPAASPIPDKSQDEDVGPLMYPCVPLITPIAKLKDGQILTIKGTVLKNADRFQIELLMNGLDGPGDRALHINPRFSGNNYIVRNTYLNKKWGNEERWGSGFPFSHGDKFECILLVQSDCYKIAFNGNHFCDYKHRVMKSTVTHLAVSGAVTLTSVKFSQSNSPSLPGKILNDYTMPVPYSQKFISGLQPGRVIYISGITKSPSYDRFQINFLDNYRQIPFHFNPRCNEQVVIRNQLTTGTLGRWGTEERDQPYFPFPAGEHFDIIIMIDSKQFRIEVNGQHFCLFQHRQKKLQQITLLEISGDIKLQNVRL